MQIIKKEILEFSEEETKALQLVTEMCLGIEREAKNPELVKLAKTAFEKLSELWGYEE
jgi:hypothetical protein